MSLGEPAWGFVGGILGGTVSGVVVQWYGQRLRLRLDRQILRADALMDITISLEQLEDAWQKATVHPEQQIALDSLRRDLASHRHIIGPARHRALRQLLHEIEQATAEGDAVRARALVKLALRQLT